MISLHKLNSDIAFPDPQQALADPNGLLAFGGDLSIKRLVLAYRSGIFPWFSEGEPILWWSPDPRGVIFTKEYKSSKSLVKHIRKQNLTVTTDKAFDRVIELCAAVPRSDNGTWITRSMIDAYKALHQAGYAHSIEVWKEQKLIGGLYGVFVNNVYCGESMFSLETNASKVAFHFLVEHLLGMGVSLIDCQMQNQHLASLGCITLSRKKFLTLISTEKPISTVNWQAKVIAP